MRALFALIGLLASTIGVNAQTQLTSSASDASANAVPTNSLVSQPNTAANPEKPHSAYDSLLDLPPLPRNKIALTCGTVTNIDPVLNRITIQPFGSKKQIHLAFDTRSQIYRDGKPAAARDIRTGDRVDIDSMLDGTRVFAKTIHIRVSALSGYAHGQIVSYDPGSRALTLRDDLSDQEAQFRLSPQTVIRNGDETLSSADLKPGSLISLDFSDQLAAPVVREILLLAEPGDAFVFFGKITFLDLSRKLIAVNNQSDGKTYEIRLTTVSRDVIQDLREGRDVTVSAVFDGTGYRARSMTVTSR